MSNNEIKLRPTPWYDNRLLFLQLTVFTVVGGCLLVVVQPVVEGHKLEAEHVTTPSLSSMASPVLGLDQPMKQGPVTLSTAQVS